MTIPKVREVSAKKGMKVRPKQPMKIHSFLGTTRKLPMFMVGEILDWDRTTVLVKFMFPDGHILILRTNPDRLVVATGGLEIKKAPNKQKPSSEFKETTTSIVDVPLDKVKKARVSRGKKVIS